MGLAAVTLLVSVTGIGAATPASGQALALPTPKDFVSHLDLECFQTDPARPPQLPTPLVLSHLNPALANVPRFQATLGERTQLCAPVAKNDRIPPPGVLDFVRFVDLACYRLGGPNAAVPLTLSHLNPQLSTLPRTQVRVRENRQLCVPVRKNNQEIPPEVLRIISFVDLEKYDIVAATTLPPIGLRLRHINPLLAHLPAEGARLLARQQLALPVAKNGLIPPG